MTAPAPTYPNAPEILEGRCHDCAGLVRVEVWATPRHWAHNLGRTQVELLRCPVCGMPFPVTLTRVDDPLAWMRPTPDVPEEPSWD